MDFPLFCSRLRFYDEKRAKLPPGLVLPEEKRERVSGGKKRKRTHEKVKEEEREAARRRKIVEDAQVSCGPSSACAYKSMYRFCESP